MDQQDNRRQASGEESPPDLEHISDKIQALNRQAVHAFLNQSGDVDVLCRQALALAAPDGMDVPLYPAGAAESWQTLGRLYMARSDHGMALDYFQRSLDLYRQAGCERELTLSKSYIGITVMSLGDYSRAAEILIQALAKAEALPDDLLAAEIMNDLSYTYVLAGQPELALAHLQRCIKVFRDLNDDLRLSWALESLGQAYLLIGRKKEALACVLEGIQLAERCKIWRDVVRFKHSAGVMYSANGNQSYARIMFQEELELAHKFDLRGDECAAMFSIADLFLQNEDFELALPLLQQALEIAEQTKIQPHLRQCCLLLSRAYKQQGDLARALAFHERFYEIDKAIFNNEADLRLRNIQVLYQLEAANREAELYQLRALALQQEIEERKLVAVDLERMARTDPLTNLLNRRAFFELAETAVKHALATHEPLSLILMDVDRFKDVNDRYGHIIGDKVLTLIAERLSHSVRSGDRLARYGGEEFIVLLPGVRLAQAMATAERLRMSVSAKPVYTNGIALEVTISLGIAEITPQLPGESLDQLIIRADKALYKVKNTGRNAASSLESV